MSKKKKDNKLLVIGSVTFILVATMIFVVINKSSDKYEKPKTIFLEKLQGKTEDVGAIDIESKGQAIKLREIGGKWLITNKHNYEVHKSLVNKLIVGAEQLKIVEKKTSNPERFHSLGLTGPKNKESESIRIILSDSTSDNIYADFLRGKQRMFGKLENENAIYVRETNDNQTYLVKGELAFDINANTFLNRPEYSIEKDRILRVSYYPATGDDYEISRMMPSSDFEISTPPTEAHSKSRLNRMGLILDGKFEIVDARPDRTSSYGKKYLNKISFRTFDGLEFNINIVESGKESGTWIKISAIAVKSLLKNEANNINLVARNWIYRVSEGTSDLIMKQLSDIVRKPREKNKNN